MRRYRLLAFGLVLLGLIAAVGLVLPTAGVLAQSGTPAAPAEQVAGTPADPAAPPAGSPAATEAAPAPTEVAPAPTEAAPAPTEAPTAPTEAAPAPTTAPPAAGSPVPAATEQAATEQAASEQTAAPGPAETPAAETPAAAPEVPGTTDVVTLVGWYFNEPNGEFLDIVPMKVASDTVADREAGAKAIGRAEFPEEDLPRIEWGDTTFTAYLRYEGDYPQQWVWFDQAEGLRPATLVMQVEGRGGKYDRYYGTATFVSRDPAVGGPIILALRPPGSENGGEQAAAEGTPTP